MILRYLQHVKGKLPVETSSSNFLREIKQMSFQRREKYIVCTLDPERFAEKNQKRLHIGDLQCFNPLVMLRNQSNPAIPILGPRLCYDMTKASGKRENLHYPPNTKAFLYYFKSPDKPRIAGELRFRVASSDDHVAFQSGFDLLKPNGQLWSRPLHVVSKSYTPLYENMRGDRLIPDDLDANLSTLPPLSPRYRRCQTLYTLNDRFTIDFSTDQHFCVVTEQGVETLHLLRQFVERQFVENQEKRRLPYKGSFLAQFERSTLPDHKDSRTVVLRFLKVIQPVEYEIPDYEGRIAQPEEGELYQRSYKSIPKVWSVDIDQKGILSRSLQLLWDA